MENDSDITAEERAAIVAFTVCRYGRITRAQIVKLTGLSSGGAKHLICRISRVIPVYYEPAEHSWIVCPVE